RLPSPPGPTGLDHPTPGIGGVGKAIGESLGEFSVMPGPCGVHALNGSVQAGRTARGTTVGGEMLHLAVGDQGFQVEADGVGMDPEPFGDLGDTHRVVTLS